MTAQRRPHLVIFDMDGVLCGYHPERRLPYFAAITGLNPDEIDRRIWRSDFEHAAEEGAYPDGDAYLAEFNARLRPEARRDVTRDEFIEARRLIMEDRPEMVALAKDLARKVDIAILTNNGALVREIIPVVAPEIAAFAGDRFHASCEFGFRKPDPRLFEAIADRYGVPIEACLLIDDSERNTKGALASGLLAHHFTTIEDLREALSVYNL